VINFFPLFFEHKSLLENSKKYIFTSGRLMVLSLVFGKSKGRNLNVKLIRLANLKKKM